VHGCLLLLLLLRILGLGRSSRRLLRWRRLLGSVLLLQHPPAQPTAAAAENKGTPKKEL
jgi:Tfp pilus assembly protein PilN